MYSIDGTVLCHCSTASLILPSGSAQGYRIDGLNHSTQSGCSPRTLRSRLVHCNRDPRICRGAMDHLMGCKYEGDYRIWIPRIRYILRRDCATMGPVQVVHPPKTIPGPTTPVPIPAPQDADDVRGDNDEKNRARAAEPPAREKLTIRVPGPLPSSCLIDDR